VTIFWDTIFAIYLLKKYNNNIKTDGVIEVN